MVPLFEEIAQDDDRPSHTPGPIVAVGCFHPFALLRVPSASAACLFFDLTRVRCEAVRLKVAVEMSLHLAVNTPSTKSRRKQVAVIICGNVAIMLMYASCCAPEGRCFRVVCGSTQIHRGKFGTGSQIPQIVVAMRGFGLVAPLLR